MNASLSKTQRERFLASGRRVGKNMCTHSDIKNERKRGERTKIYSTTIEKRERFWQLESQTWSVPQVPVIIDFPACFVNIFITNQPCAFTCEIRELASFESTIPLQKEGTSTRIFIFGVALQVFRMNHRVKQAGGDGCLSFLRIPLSAIYPRKWRFWCCRG